MNINCVTMATSRHEHKLCDHGNKELCPAQKGGSHYTMFEPSSCPIQPFQTTVFFRTFIRLVMLVSFFVSIPTEGPWALGWLNMVYYINCRESMNIITSYEGNVKPEATNEQWSSIKASNYITTLLLVYYMAIVVLLTFLLSILY